MSTRLRTLPWPNGTGIRGLGFPIVGHRGPIAILETESFCHKRRFVRHLVAFDERYPSGLAGGEASTACGNSDAVEADIDFAWSFFVRDKLERAGMSVVGRADL